MNIRSEWNENSSTSFSGLFYTKEETISSVIENFNYRRFHSAEGHSITIGGITEQVIIQDHSNPINESKTDKKMLIPMDSISKSGDYVVFRGETWIINSHINIVDDGYKTCQIYRCNYTLLFQSPTGVILSYPCIDSTNSSIGLDVSNVITTGNSIHNIKLPFDSSTINLRTGKRFFLDYHPTTPIPYAITKVNNTEFKYGDKGLIELTNY